MLKYLLKRLAVLIPTFLGVTLVSFFLIRLVPGDPVMLLLGERGASPELYNQLKENLGLNDPIFIQYFRFLSNAIQGDLQTSIITTEPVLSEFLARFPATLELGFFALLIATVVGIPAGILAAYKRNSIVDSTFMTASLVGYSMPVFWWALILIMVFSVNFGLTPVSGRISAMYDVDSVTGFLLIDTLLMDYESWEAFLSALEHLILPSVALATIPLAVITRMTRSSLLEVLGEDYIRSAKARGLSNFTVVCVHALRNALIPVVTVIGLMVGTIFAGAILTETIFSWPGIGKWLFKSVTSRDYPVVQGAILLIATMVILVNLTVDVVNALINPKLRNAK